jgi:hypothetical protein
MGGQHSSMGGQQGSYMSGKGGFMDDKGSDMMNDKNSYMDGKNEMDGGKNYNSGKTEMINDKNFIDKSWMNDKGDMNDKNSYMNDKNSDMDDKNSDMDDKNSYMEPKESGSFKGGHKMMGGEGKNYMESSPPAAFKPFDYDTHSVDKSCEGDYKECNQGWNACKTPCFGAQSFGAYGGSVRESDQNDMNTVKAIAAMDTQKTVDMLGKHDGLQVSAGASQEREPTNSEVQDNDTKIAAALSGHDIGVAPQTRPVEGLVQSGGEAVEPYKNTITPPGTKETI